MISASFVYLLPSQNKYNFGWVIFKWNLHKTGYKHLDYQKRCQILAFWKAGYKQRDIAKEIGVHESTISRELKRNITYIRTKLGSWQYKPDYAQATLIRDIKRKINL